ncbi:MAG: HEAT repeat domain-containing protein [Gemmataceae bacterium]|nr:HEAT repeat domain-containing protein [Gemmataceae bacterium]
MIRVVLLSILTLAIVLPLRAADEPNFNGRTLSEWLAILKDDSLVRKRKAALVALGQMVAGDEETRKKAMPGIAKALKVDGNAGVRAQAAALMGQQPIESAALVVGDLAEALRSEKESDVRKELAVAAGKFGRLSGSAVLPLADVLKDPKPETRAAAADALGRIGKEARKAAPYVVPLTKDADRAVRFAAVFALGRLDPDDSETACETLVEILEKESAKKDKERDGEMISATIVSLGLLGEKSTAAVKAIARHLGDSDVERRQLAALTLGRFGIVGRVASAELKKAFQEDADKTVRANALHSLGVSHGADAKDLIPVLTTRLKADPDFEVRIAVAEMLGSFGPNGKPAIPALQEARRDSQLKVREAATLAIRAIEKPAEKPTEKPKP